MERLETSVKGSRLTYALVNLLTLSRFFLTFVYVEQIVAKTGSLTGYFVIFALVVLTDFMDGKLARAWAVQSKLGSMLDVSADLFFVLASSTALYMRALFPLWMIAVILLKTFEFFATSTVLKRQRKNLSENELNRLCFHKSNLSRRSLFVYDVLGRIVAAVFYVLPMVVMLLQELLEASILHSTLFVVFVSVSGSALVSSLHRIYLCISGAR